MSPSNYIPIYFDRPIAHAPPPFAIRPHHRARSAFRNIRPDSECSATTIDDAERIAMPSSTIVRPAAVAHAAPPSAWTTTGYRLSMASETSFETEFTDCMTDSDGDYAPTLSPVAESPTSIRHPSSPPRARLSRTCTVTRLPPVRARVAVRGPIVLPSSLG